MQGTACSNRLLQLLTASVAMPHRNHFISTVEARPPQHFYAGVGPTAGRRLLELAEFWFAVFATVFMYGALTRLLSPGEDAIQAARQAGQGTPGAPFVQVTAIFIYLCTAFFVLRHFPKIKKQILPNLVVFAPVVLAIASTAWSLDPPITLRRSIALLGTTLTAFFIATRFAPRIIIQIFAVSALAVLLLSLLAVAAFPGFGVHSADDAIGANHAGSFRALFFHKNGFAQFCVLAILFFVGFYRYIALPRAVRIGSILVGFAMIAGAGSAQGVVQAAVLPLLMIYHEQIMRWRPSVRALLVTLAIVAAVPLMFFWDVLLVFVLEALGRDPTLSNRTIIWQGVLAGGRETLLLGGGFEAGWSKSIQDHLNALIYSNPGHAHNGFLDYWIDLGIVGLIPIAFVWVTYVVRMNRMIDSSLGRKFRIFAIYFLIFYLSSNFMDSYLMLHQNYYWFVLSLLTFFMYRYGEPVRMRT